MSYAETAALRSWDRRRSAGAVASAGPVGEAWRERCGRGFVWVIWRGDFGAWTKLSLSVPAWVG
jgi:hypothetical protein